MEYVSWEGLDEEIKEVVMESIELYPEWGSTFLNLYPRLHLIESTSGPRHNAPISVPFSMIIKTDIFKTSFEIDYETIHKMIEEI